MSIFIAPDAEGTLTVWADVPGKDPVALLTEQDVRSAAMPVATVSDPRWDAADAGSAELWQLILANVPQYDRTVTARWEVASGMDRADGAASVEATADYEWYIVHGLDPDDFTLIP